MAQLNVDDVPDEIVLELKERARRSGRSMEAEHREILLRALRPFSKQRLLDVLQAGPFSEPDFKLEWSKETGATSSFEHAIALSHAASPSLAQLYPYRITREPCRPGSS